MTRRQWKQGNGNTVIVAPKRNLQGALVGRWSDTQYYGGPLICESISSTSSMNLIVAAPDLLEACKQIIQAETIQEFQAALKVCAEAIEKAEPTTKLIPQFSSVTINQFNNQQQQ